MSDESMSRDRSADNSPHATLARRDVLKVIVAAGLAGSCRVGWGAERAAAPAGAGTVDVHHHYLPPFYREHARNWLAANASASDRIMNWSPERAKEALEAAHI